MNEKVLKIHNLLHNNSLALSVAHNLKKINYWNHILDL